MAAELGTMRVTEQIDALMVMALNPIKYLVVPRIMLLYHAPILTIIADFVGKWGGILWGKTPRINEGRISTRRSSTLILTTYIMD